MEENRPKLETVQIVGMFAAACAGDLVTLIPLTGWLVTSTFWAVLSIYLWRKGFGFVNTRRLATMAISLVAGWIPVLEALPELIVGVSVVIALMKAEEKTGISVTSLAKGKISMSQAAQTYKYKNGRRESDASGKPPLNTGDTRLPTEA
jgi:hypothetical protein